MSNSPTIVTDLPKLRETITDLFNEDEIRTLCFDLGIDFEELQPGGKSAKVRELIALCVRTQRLDALLRSCEQARPETSWPSVVPQTTQGPSPFQGLQFYDVGDTDRFFGRERWIVQLVHRLNFFLQGEGEAPRFLAVIGASGSGKSSLVRAGLVPTLQKSRLPLPNIDLPQNTDKWSIYLFTPTSQPLKALATSLTRDDESVRKTTTFIDDMLHEPRSLDIFLHKLVAKGNAERILIVVDQFEELFSLCRDEAERQRFIQNLTTAVAPGTIGPAIVIITLRADFYHRCADYDELRQLLSQQQEYIGPMNEVELREAIQEPAKQQGLQIEDGLVDRLLQEVGNEPGALPLLSHALHETWKRREGNLLTHVGYQATGGVRGAIAQTAERTFTQLAPAQQLLTRMLFLRLTELGEGIEDTRRRVQLEELLTMASGNEEVAGIIKILADNRLITTSQDVIEVAHEALIREWPRLRNWLDEDRAGLRTHRQLTEAAYAWRENGQDPSYLYRGARLAAAEEWRGEYAAQLSPLENNFLETSMLNRATEQKKARRRVQVTILGLFLALLIITIFSVVAWRQRNDAIALQQTILAQELTTNANALIGEDNELALLLAKEAVQRDHTFETEDVLRRALRQPLAVQLPVIHPGVRIMSFSPDGNQLLTAGDDTKARLWLWPEGELIAEFEGHTGWIVDTDFSPDQKQIVTASIDGTVNVWEAQTGSLVYTLPAPIGDLLDARFWRVRFSPDGHYILTGRADGQVKLWDADTGNPVTTLPNHVGAVTSLAFNSVGSQIVTSGEDAVAILWQTASESHIELRGHTGKIWQVRFSPNGQLVGTASVDGTAILWDAATGTQLHTLVGHDLSVTTNSGSLGLMDIAFSPNSLIVVTASQDGTARVWNADSGELISELVGHSGIVQSVAFHPTQPLILTSGMDRTARLWNAYTGEELLSFSPTFPNSNGEAGSNRLVFDPTGEHVLSVGEDGQLLSWSTSQTLGDLVAKLPGYLEQFSQENDRYLTSDFDSIYVWDTDSWELVTTLASNKTSENFSIIDPRLSPDGRLVLGVYGPRWTMVEDRRVAVWDARTGERLSELSAFAVQATFSPDGRYFSIESWGPSTRLYRTSTLEEVPIPDNPEIANIYFTGCPDILITTDQNQVKQQYDFSTQTFAPLNLSNVTQYFCDNANKRLVLQADDLGNIRIKNLDTQETLLTVPGQFAVFSPDGELIAVANEGSISIWQLKTGNLVQEFTPEFWPIYSLSFSPDARNIVLIGGAERNEVWHIDPLEQILTGIATFSPDGTYMVTTEENSSESAVRIRETTAGEVIALLQVADSTTIQAGFSPDGRYVLTSNWQGPTRVWLVHLEDLMAIAEQKTTRILSCEEKLIYLHESIECPP